MRSSFLDSTKPIVVIPTPPLKIHVIGFEDAVDERAIPHVAYTIQTVMQWTPPTAFADAVDVQLLPSCPQRLPTPPNYCLHRPTAAHLPHHHLPPPLSVC